MDGQTIRCPNCGSKIPLTEAFYSQVREGLRKEYEAKEQARTAELRERERSLEARLAEVEASKKSLNEELARKLAVEKAKLEDEAKKKARADMEVELKDLREEAEERRKELDSARAAELDFRKKLRELEDEKKNMELEVARRMDVERERIRQSTLEVFTEEHRLKDREKDKKIEDMLKTIAELKRKGEQGSMQAQGEVLELDLEGLLSSRFPMDDIDPVPKGVRGADIIQRVHSRSGARCGSIIWEMKRTKAWNDEWLTKLKDDQREVAAEVAVIVTEAMPRGLTTFGLVEGVWVSSIPLAGALAEALRVGLVQVSQSRASAVGKGEKMEAIYGYLSGAEFKQKIEAIVESFKAMKLDLDKEKAAMNRIWAKREKQIERVVTNTVRMYGDMQGIIGASLPEIKSLELEGGTEVDDEEEEDL